MEEDAEQAKGGQDEVGGPAGKKGGETLAHNQKKHGPHKRTGLEGSFGPLRIEEGLAEKVERGGVAGVHQQHQGAESRAEKGIGDGQEDGLLEPEAERKDDQERHSGQEGTQPELVPQQPLYINGTGPETTEVCRLDAESILGERDGRKGDEKEEP